MCWDALRSSYRVLLRSGPFLKNQALTAISFDPDLPPSPISLTPIFQGAVHACVGGPALQAFGQNTRRADEADWLGTKSSGRGLHALAGDVDLRRPALGSTV